VSQARLIADLHSKVKRVLWDTEMGRCVICRKPASDAAHIFVRNKLATAFDTEEDGNVHLLCRNCHADDHSGDGRYRRWYTERFGIESLEALERRSNVMLVNVKAFLKEKENELDEELECLSAEWGSGYGDRGNRMPRG